MCASYVIAIILLAACGQGAPAATPVSTPTLSPSPTPEPTPSAQEVCDELVGDLVILLSDFVSRSAVGVNRGDYVPLVGDMQVEIDRIDRAQANVSDACREQVIRPLTEAVGHHRAAVEEWQCSSPASCAFVNESDIQMFWAMAAQRLDHATSALDRMD